MGNTKRLLENRLRNINHRIRQQELFLTKVQEVGTQEEFADARHELVKLKCYKLDLLTALVKHQMNVA